MRLTGKHMETTEQLIDRKITQHEYQNNIYGWLFVSAMVFHDIVFWVLLK